MAKKYTLADAQKENQKLREQVEKLEQLLSSYPLWKDNVNYHMEKTEKRLKELEG